MARGSFRSQLNERRLDVIAFGLAIPSEPEDAEGCDASGSVHNSDERRIRRLRTGPDVRSALEYNEVLYNAKIQRTDLQTPWLI